MLSPNRDEVALGIEDVHLDEAVVVRRRRRPVDDEEDEVVVLLELRALAELLRVLERERVEAEDVAEESRNLPAQGDRGRARRTRRSRGATRSRLWSTSVVRRAFAVEERRRHGSPVTLTPLDTL